LRVLHVINSLGPGGAETVLFRLATHKGEAQHEIVSLDAPDWYSAKLEQAGIRVHHVNWSLPAAPFAMMRLHRLIRDSGADIVQSWLYRANLLAGLSARAASKPIVWNIRCSSLEPLGLPSRMLAYLGGSLTRWLPRFVINCSARSVTIHDRLGYGAVPGTVISNGYDASLLCMDEKARAETRSSLGIDPGAFVIGTIARWHAQKGIPVLLQAFRTVRERGIPALMVLTGRGLDADNQELSQLIRATGHADDVQALGARGDVPAIARALDLHVLASVGSEAFPNVVAETMLSGTPNVVTDVGEAGLIVGDTGWVIAPGSADELADAIAKAYAEWSSSPRDWRKRRDAARQRISDNYSLERMVGAYEDVWRNVLAKCGPAPAPPST
jgi:glycosyltransferase involved in cell wall biosynthesis